jgi:hypothetical protein
MIISCDYLNLSLANEYVGDVTIPTQVILQTSQVSNAISLGRFFSGTPPASNSSISSGRLSIRTPPSFVVGE